MKSILLLAMIFIALASCTTEEIGNSRDVNPETIYTRYSIISNETDSNVICKAQFRFAGPVGTTLYLNDPSQVMLDGKLLIADSNTYQGVYYPYKKRCAEFAGKHKWTFTDINEKQFETPFTYRRIALADAEPLQFNQHLLQMHLRGASTNDSLFISFYDTSHNVIMRSLDCSAGVVNIHDSMLKKLSPGPLELEFYIENNQALANATKEGGRLILTYRFKERMVRLQN